MDLALKLLTAERVRFDNQLHTQLHLGLERFFISFRREKCEEKDFM